MKKKSGIKEKKIHPERGSVGVGPNPPNSGFCGTHPVEHWSNGDNWRLRLMYGVQLLVDPQTRSVGLDI